MANKQNRNFQRFNQQTQAKPVDVFEDPEVLQDVSPVGIEGAVSPDDSGLVKEGFQEQYDEREGEDNPDQDLNSDTIEDTELEVVEDSVDEEEDLDEEGTDYEEADGEIVELEVHEGEEDDIEGTDTPLDYPFTEVASWSTEQLAHYISRPENMDIYHSKLLNAIDEHRRRSTDLDRAWSVDECTYFFKDDIVPEKTQFGNYLHDVTRKLRRENEWTTQELESWAMGDIRPEGLVTTGGLAAELHSRFKMPIQSVDPEIVIAHYKYNFGPNKGKSVVKVGEVPTVTAEAVTPEVQVEVERKIKYAGLNDMNQSYIEETLKRYVERVRPNRVITQKDGFEAQRELDTVLHYILKLEDPVAVKSGLDILVTTIVAERIHNVKGVFNDTNIFRFAEGIKLEGKQQEIHRRLFTLLFAFIDGDEGILAQTDVGELIKYLPQRQQTMLLGYLRRS